VSLLSLATWGAFLMLTAQGKFYGHLAVIAAKAIAVLAFCIGFGGVGFALGTLLARLIWWTLVNP
jgi:hypothetical protein